MIKLFLDYLYSAPNLSAGLDEAIITTQASVNIFIPMLLFFVGATVFIGGSLSQKRRTGRFDAAMWMTVAMMSVVMVTLPLTLTAGLIELPTLVIVVVLTIASGFWLFLDRNKNEVY